MLNEQKSVFWSGLKSESLAVPLALSVARDETCGNGSALDASPIAMGMVLDSPEDFRHGVMVDGFREEKDFFFSFFVLRGDEFHHLCALLFLMGLKLGLFLYGKRALLARIRRHAV